MTITVHVGVIWCEDHKKGRWGVSTKHPQLGTSNAFGVCPEGSTGVTYAYLHACYLGIRTAIRTWSYTKDIVVYAPDEAMLRVAAGLKTKKSGKRPEWAEWAKKFQTLISERGLTIRFEKAGVSDKGFQSAKKLARKAPACHAAWPGPSNEDMVPPKKHKKTQTKSRGGITKILGELGRERGKANEKLVLDAVQRLSLEWITSARLATREEDHRKIDIVCESIYGPLYLQVKSSQTGKEIFKEAVPRSTLIECVIATPLTEVLDERVRNALFRLRSYAKTRVSQITDNG